MNKNTKARITTVAAGAALLAVFGGGSAVAGSLITSAQIKDNTVSTADLRNNDIRSADIRDNAVTSKDVNDGSLLGHDIKDGSLLNADISVFNASVESDGNVAYSSGGVTVDHFNEGAYRVSFPRNIQGCSITATPASPNTGFAPQANLGLSDVADQPNTVLVAARFMIDQNDPINVGFNLIAVC